MNRTVSATNVLATLLAAASLTLAAVSLAFAWANQGLPVNSMVVDAPKWFGTQNALSTVVFAAPGWYLAMKAPRVPFGWVLLVGALAHGIAGAGWGYMVASEVAHRDYPLPWLAVVLSASGAAVEVAILAFILTFYPDGKRPAGVIGWVGIACVGLGIAGVAVAVVDPFSALAQDPNSSLAQLNNPIGVPAIARFTDEGFLLLAPAAIASLFVLVVRWIRATGESKQVLRWVVLGIVVSFVTLPLDLMGNEWEMLSAQLPTVLILAALVAGSLRHRVYGIEVVVSRAFVYATLLGVVALVFGSIVGTSLLIAGEVSVAASFVAATAAAFALMPLRSWVERAINRILFGRRDEPFAILSEVASQLDSAAAPSELLPGFASHVRTQLRVPVVAVSYGEGAGQVRVQSGNTDGSVYQLTLTNQGSAIGTLEIGLRKGETRFSDAEIELLRSLARQAAAAVTNIMLAEDLRESRERIVAAREEERRRLRRDLHDGLGPVLTGAAMMIDAGRNAMRDDPDVADAQLQDARAHVRGAIEDVRRLVYALRPPALDELGLVGALREQARSCTANVTINARGAVDALPAAVEVAAFRIAAEAMNNATRHSGATVCTVNIFAGDVLEVEVCDNGQSAGPWRPGVGISSMCERAAELSGSCDSGPDWNGHGRVHAIIPLGVPS